jgi:hypothetical protein
VPTWGVCQCGIYPWKRLQCVGYTYMLMWRVEDYANVWSMPLWEVCCVRSLQREEYATVVWEYTSVRSTEYAKMRTMQCVECASVRSMLLWLACEVRSMSQWGICQYEEYRMPLWGVCQCVEYAIVRSLPVWRVCQFEEYHSVRACQCEVYAAVGSTLVWRVC